MRFIDSALAETRGIWDDCVKCKFLEEIGNGTIKREKFYDYLIQDSLYLRDFLKVFAYGLIKSDNLADMQTFYSFLGFIKDGENKTRLDYLAERGLTDADIDKMQRKPACKNYCDFLLQTASTGEVPEILMALLPCMAGYGYVFKHFVDKAPQTKEGYFAPFVGDYINDYFQETCEFWLNFANEKCENLDEKRKQKLLEIFREASLHELKFWQMAGED